MNMKLRASFRNLLLAGFLALLAAANALPASAAQTGATFSNVLVDIWPEYDRTTVLVMYNISLAPSVSLPATISLRIPSQVGEPHAVAMQDVSGLYELSYTLNAAGEWIEVQFTTPVPDVRLEFYDPSLRKDGAQRSYTYRWPGNYAVENLSIRVQQPVNATGMSFIPDIGPGRPDDDGLTYFTLVAGQVDAGESFELVMSYDKADDTLTNPQQFQPARPVEPVGPGTEGRVTLFQGLSMSTLQLIILILGIALIVGGVAWFMLTSRVAAPAGQRSRRRHGRSGSGAAAAADDDDEPVFCHRCGKRSAPGDIFCRSCGAELRR